MKLLAVIVVLLAAIAAGCDCNEMAYIEADGAWTAKYMDVTKGVRDGSGVGTPNDPIDIYDRQDGFLAVRLDSGTYVRVRIQCPGWHPLCECHETDWKKATTIGQWAEAKIQ
jgi:hypothetical protein